MALVVKESNTRRSSGLICAVFNCSNNQKKLYKWNNSKCEFHDMLHKDCPCLVPYQLHRFPRDDSICKQWIVALHRKDYKPGKSSRVCSLHFLDGRPSKENPVPQLHLGYPKKVVKGRVPLKRISLQEKESPKRPCQVFQENTTPAVEDTGNSAATQTFDLPLTEPTGNSTSPSSAPIYVLKEHKETKEKECQVTALKKDGSTQYEKASSVVYDHLYVKDISCSSVKLNCVSTQVNTPELSATSLTTKDCLFYTGVKLDMFLYMVNFLSVHANSMGFVMDVGDQILLVLMRLRLGLLFHDLGCRFKISTSLASKIFNTWILVMAVQLKGIITWLSRETIRANLPKCFKSCYPNTTCIIDCTEVFIQRPSFLRSRATTYSSYKGNNTLKFLVAIAPHGYVMFVSKCYGGRASDKHIVVDCGIMDYILPKDEVMCDRGFTIEEEVMSKNAKMNIPAFTKNKAQLTETEVTATRRIASVRIHVERAINRIKNYRILKNMMNVKKLHKTADNIVLICAALSNLQPPLIK